MKFSNFYYTGLIDRNFKTLYCDSSRVFNRMNASHVKLQRKMDGAKITNTAYGTFTMDSVLHLVAVEPVLDDLFMVRIMPQLPDEVIDNKELCEEIDQVGNGTMDVYTHLSMVKIFLDQCKYEEARKYVKYGMMCSSNISVDCMNLRNRFDNDPYITFVDLRRRLIRTGDIINYAIESFEIGKRVYFTYDIETPYVCLDYKQLEFVLYNLSKLAILLTRSGSESYIEISSVSNEFIELYAKIPLQQNLPFVKFKNEICAVKHAFKKLGGCLNLYEEEGYFCGAGHFDASFSANRDIVPRGMRMVVRRSISEMLERTESSFYPVFEYDEKHPYALRVPEKKLPEQLNWELQYAKIFFEGIDLLNEE